MTEQQRSWKNYRPVRFPIVTHETLKERAAKLAQERGQQEVTLPSYLMEASQFFENNRAKPEVQP